MAKATLIDSHAPWPGLEDHLLDQGYRELKSVEDARAFSKDDLDLFVVVSPESANYYLLTEEDVRVVW